MDFSMEPNWKGLAYEGYSREVLQSLVSVSWREIYSVYAFSMEPCWSTRTDMGYIHFTDRVIIKIIVIISPLKQTDQLLYCC